MLDQLASVPRQIIFLIILLIVGHAVLLVRRKANGGKSLFKLVLILLGVLISATTFGVGNKIFFETDFMKNISVILLIILCFELSMRLNPDNIRTKSKALLTTISILLTNMILLTIVVSALLHLKIIYALIFAILISSIEYFFIEEIRAEGDISNPIIILLVFIILYLLGEQPRDFIQIAQYILIGIGTGIVAGIIVFNAVRGHKLDWIHHIGFVAVAISAYVYTEVMLGSGIISVLTLGLMLGNSFVSKSKQIVSLSPFIYKSMEIIIYMFAGYEIYTNFEIFSMITGIIIFLCYMFVRFLVISLIYSNFSFRNRWLISTAPKGMVFACMTILLATYSYMPYQIITSMIIAMILSLLFSSIVEYFENEKIKRVDHYLKIIGNIRYGKKRKKLFHYSGRQNKT